jgi:hypothetical protein
MASRRRSAKSTRQHPPAPPPAPPDGRYRRIEFSGVGHVSFSVTIPNHAQPQQPLNCALRVLNGVGCPSYTCQRGRLREDETVSVENVHSRRQRASKGAVAYAARLLGR